MIRHPSKEAWAQTENLLDLGGSWLIQERVSTAYLHQTNMTASAGHTVGCSRAAEVCAVGFGWFRGCFGCLAVWNLCFLSSSSGPHSSNLVLQNPKERITEEK